MKTRIMYIERKAGELQGEARIARITFSKTGKTIYYRDLVLQRITGTAFKPSKSNYYDQRTGEDYWVSGPKRNGLDRLYGRGVAVEIDEDVREEYWATIRKQPANKASRFT